MKAVGRGGNGVLDGSEMMATALKRAGRRGFADLTFVDPFERLLKAYDTEADLSAFGHYAVHFDSMRCLKNLLYFDSVEEADPAVLSRRIVGPIFITGLPRSGTTFLHTLLAQDPDNAVPLSWQSVYPNPSRGRILGLDFRLLWLTVQFGVMKLMSRELNDLHPLSVDTPQECTDITAQVFQSLRFDSTYRIPSYQRWLGHHGHLDAYRFHRRFLQHLDGQAPGRQWVLKSPDHVFALDAIRTVYPDAQIVFLHRDPVSVLASVAKLTEVLRRPFTRSLDRLEIGRQVSASWLDGANRMIAAKSASGNILHLHYREVVSAPMDAVATLYRHCGLVLSGTARQRMQLWLARAPAGGHGQNRYSLAEFGLDQKSLRAGFASYMEEFAVAPEWDSAQDMPARAA